MAISELEKAIADQNMTDLPEAVTEIVSEYCEYLRVFVDSSTLHGWLRMFHAHGRCMPDHGCFTKPGFHEILYLHLPKHAKHIWKHEAHLAKPDFEQILAISKPLSKFDMFQKDVLLESLQSKQT